MLLKHAYSVIGSATFSYNVEPANCSFTTIRSFYCHASVIMLKVSVPSSLIELFRRQYEEG